MKLLHVLRKLKKVSVSVTVIKAITCSNFVISFWVHYVHKSTTAKVTGCEILLYVTRRNWLVMNWYSFLCHEYGFFKLSAILSHLIALEILKSQNILHLLPPEIPLVLCPDPKLQKQSLYNHFAPCPKKRH